MDYRSDRQVPEEIWTEVRDIVQEAVIKAITKKKKCKKAKWLSDEALLNPKQAYGLQMFSAIF